MFIVIFNVSTSPHMYPVNVRKQTINDKKTNSKQFPNNSEKVQIMINLTLKLVNNYHLERQILVIIWMKISIIKIIYRFVQSTTQFLLIVFASLHGFSRQMEHFLTDMSNRVEHQKLNQTTAELSFG